MTLAISGENHSGNFHRRGKCRALFELFTPGAQGIYHWPGPATEGGKVVLNAGRHLGIDGPVDDSVVLEMAQPLGQGLGTYSLEGLAKLAKSLRAEKQLAHEQQSPAALEDMDCRLDRAIALACTSTVWLR